MNAKIKKLLTELTQRDFDALKSIYDFRCLSFDQIFEKHYKYSKHKKGIVSPDYFRKKMLKFKEANIIEEVQGTKTPTVYFLSSEGIKLIKEAFDFPNNIYDIEKRMHKRGYLKYSELTIADRFIPHQYNLNQFVLDVSNIFKDTPIKYSDEKHIKEFVGIRPDGILTMYDVDFFLEMDMGTENINQLNEKWDNYRRFVNSNEFAFKERKIVILFIVEGIKKINQRINLIKNTLNERFLDLIDKDIEIYVNTRDNLVRSLQEKIIPQTKGDFFKLNKLKQSLNKNHNFNIASGEKVSKYFGGTSYLLYIRREKEDEKFDEYIVEEFFDEPLSTINRIAYLAYKSSFFKEKFKRSIPLIVVVDSEKSIFNNLKLFNLFNTENVYYTTNERLERKEKLNEAIFNISNVGDIFHFEDSELQKRVFERTIK